MGVFNGAFPITAGKEDVDMSADGGPPPVVVLDWTA